ncbi:alpha-hydroxy-acid oxidizing protein [Caldiplasma sukawensis]
MTNLGTQYQLMRYLKADEEGDFPVSIEKWRESARMKLDKNAWWYIESSAGSGSTELHNEERLNHYRIRPRYARNVENSTISTEIFGKSFLTPFIIAPLGAMSIVNPQADLIGATVAEKLGLIFCLSTVSSWSIEEVAKAAPNAEKWFQLYPGKDMDVMRNFVKRAETSGYKAIVVTFDTTMLGWREKDLENRYLPFVEGHGTKNYFTDPYFLKRLSKPVEEDRMSAIMEWSSIYVNPGFDWEYFDHIRKWTSLPILVKGINSPEDVKLSFEHKANGVIVSNHGGRQVDGAIASIDALNEITGEGNYDGHLIFDSGVRRAADVMRAFALGANAVMIGRPYAYSMAVGGEKGVEAYFRQLIGELSIQLALSGFNSLKELGRNNLSII